MTSDLSGNATSPGDLSPSGPITNTSEMILVRRDDLACASFRPVYPETATFEEWEAVQRLRTALAVPVEQQVEAVARTAYEADRRGVLSADIPWDDNRSNAERGRWLNVARAVLGVTE